jgi:hypothetical protein
MKKESTLLRGLAPMLAILCLLGIVVVVVRKDPDRTAAPASIGAPKDLDAEVERETARLKKRPRIALTTEEATSAFQLGKAALDSGQLDVAMKELGAVADSDQELRSTAAIDLTNVYDELGDVVGELASMNSHPYLFDEGHQTKDVLAIAYNNRCYAYMKAGKLRAALDDCNKAVKFGSAHAVQKQQYLQERLRSPK